MMLYLGAKRSTRAAWRTRKERLWGSDRSAWNTGVCLVLQVF